MENLRLEMNGNKFEIKEFVFKYDTKNGPK